MLLSELRQTFPTFVYKSFHLKPQLLEITISYHFILGSDIEFKPVIHIPLPQSAQGLALRSPSELANFAFHLGIIEAMSYWKATCSPKLVVEAGQLTPSQVDFWHDLFLHGLGEFFYKNQIDFSTLDFLTITSSAAAPAYSMPPPKDLVGDLILGGGGKDTAVMFELLAQQENTQVMLLNPMQAASKITSTAEFNKPIIIKRTLDPLLLELNKKGYLNGHTPFSAYLAFLGILVAYLHGIERVLVANEASSAEASLVFHGMEINHQYSKSYRFEKRFREYAAAYLTPQVSYFSLLRPLTELQAAALFSTTEKYDQTFCSCNVSRNTTWCMTCAKCAFVYLVLSPFVSPQRLKKIFGDKNHFENSEMQKHLTDMLGLGNYKPLECVGTIAESRLAVALTIFKYKRLNQAIPAFLARIDQELQLTAQTTEDTFLKRLRTDWNENHFLPPEYAVLLKKKLQEIKA